MLKFLNRFVINAKFSIEDICNIYRRLKIEAGDDSDTLSYIQFMNAILPPAAQTGTLLTGNTSPVSLSPEPLKRSLHSKAHLSSSNAASKSKIKFMNERTVSKSPTPRKPDSSMRNMESQKRLGSQRSVSGFESIDPAPPREDKYSTATNATHKKNAKLYRQVWEQQQQTGGYQSLASTKMQMLASSIADPQPPDPFCGMMPMSRYKQTRLRSSKDLVSHHLNRGKSPAVAAIPQRKTPMNESSLYIMTTKGSPMKNSPSKNNTMHRRTQVNNPESSEKKRISYMNTPNQRSNSRSSKGSSRSRSKSNRGEDSDEGEEVLQIQQKPFDQEKYNLFHKLKMGYISPMKGIEEENFIERIKEWMQIENFIDKVREELILYCEDFGPVQAFRIFVQKPDKGRAITEANLQDAYELFHIPLSKEESTLIMSRIDANKDGVLTYTDICDVFRPKNNRLSREFGQRMPMELQTSQTISAKAGKLIKKLFLALLKVENHVLKMKRQLTKRPGFDVDKAFTVLNMDGLERGFDKISVAEIQGIL